MEKYYYDLHIHSCLSPCGDDEMTPPNIANMAYLKGLNIIAITDHNSARNVRAVTEAAAELPLTVIAGIELTTAEEIHVVCLFPTVDAAEQAGLAAEAALPSIANDEQAFGVQQVMTAEEVPAGTVDKLLINATSISVDDVGAFVAQYGGFAYPAHVDKQANSLIAAFGYLPDHLGFAAIEVARPTPFAATKHWQSAVERYNIVTSSDAHLLESISEAEREIELAYCDFASLRDALTKPR